MNLAAHQLAMTVFTFLAFALDALAIAAQALIGKELGAGNPAAVRELTGTMVRWGLGFGVLTGVLLAAAAPWAGVAVHLRCRTSSPRSRSPCGCSRRASLSPAMFSSWTGCSSGRGTRSTWLLPASSTWPLPAAVAGGPAAGADGGAGLLWLWAAFSLGYMLARALTLGLRARTRPVDGTRRR